MLFRCLIKKLLASRTSILLTVLLFFTLKFSRAQIANDSCSNAILLSSDTICNYYSGTTIGASTSSLLSCDSLQYPQAAWFLFIAQSTTHIIHVKPDTFMDVAVELYVQSCDSFVLLQCINNTGKGVVEELIQFNLVVGTTYYIRIYSQDTISGNFTVCLTHCNPFGQIGLISGQDILCNFPGMKCGSSDFLSNYSIAPLPDAINYNWKAPGNYFTGQGTHTISLEAGQSCTISVSVYNACKDSASVSKNLTVKPPICLWQDIMGPDKVCAGDYLNYSIDTGIYATNIHWTVSYAWTILSGQGTNAITVKANQGGSGGISVSAYNECSFDSDICYEWPTIFSKPEIIGDTIVCKKSNVKYYIPDYESWYHGSLVWSIVGQGWSMDSFSNYNDTVYLTAGNDFGIIYVYATGYPMNCHIGEFNVEVNEDCFHQNIEICSGETVTVGNNVYTETGIYIDTLTSILGVDSIVTTYLTAHSLPIANAGNDTTIIIGTSAILSGSGGDTCFWLPPLNLINQNACNTIAFPTQTTTYAVTVINKSGCIDTDQVTVFIQLLNAYQDIDAHHYFVFFSPNPFNSVTSLLINPFKNCCFYTFSLYDILGREVQQSKITNASSQINRNNLPAGIYVYQLKNKNEILAFGKLVISD